MSIVDHPSYTHSRLTEVGRQSNGNLDATRRGPGINGSGTDGPDINRSLHNDRTDNASGPSPWDSYDALGRTASGEPHAARSLVVRPWWDPDLSINGHDLEDPYVEMFWLGVLGPSAICMLRRFSRGFEQYPNGFRLSVRDTARAMGIGTGTGRNGPLNRTIDRVCTFHLARRTSLDEIEVRLHLPTLTRRQLSRLPLAVQNTHEEWVIRHGGSTGTRASTRVNASSAAPSVA